VNQQNASRRSRRGSETTQATTSLNSSNNQPINIFLRPTNLKPREDKPPPGGFDELKAARDSTARRHRQQPT
jgi:hypothetical protein